MSHPFQKTIHRCAKTILVEKKNILSYKLHLLFKFGSCLLRSRRYIGIAIDITFVSSVRENNIYNFVAQPTNTD